MRCPFCGTEDTQVKDSRPTEDHAAIRRRRFCPNCAARFTTFERVQLRELTVVKKNGQREPFDRDKLARSIQISPAQAAGRAGRASSASSIRIVRQLESSGESEIPSDVDRRAGDGSAGSARPGGLCAFRLGLSQFPRGEGFRRIHRPDQRRRRSTIARMMTDVAIMRAALALARRGLGTVWPNPAVGCVIVQDGRVVGRGWTQPGGRPHGETEALAAPARRRKRRDRLCQPRAVRHHGKTPPCADALIAAGIARVVVAMEDPDPRVSGAGHRQRLRDAGIAVETGLCAEGGGRAQCRLLPAHPRGPAARHAEAGDDARRPHRDACRREPVDHRRSGARPRRICCARPTMP